MAFNEFSAERHQAQRFTTKAIPKPMAIPVVPQKLPTNISRAARPTIKMNVRINGLTRSAYANQSEESLTTGRRG